MITWRMILAALLLPEGYDIVPEDRVLKPNEHPHKNPVRKQKPTTIEEIVREVRP